VWCIYPTLQSVHERQGFCIAAKFNAPRVHPYIPVFRCARFLDFYQHLGVPPFGGLAQSRTWKKTEVRCVNFRLRVPVEDAGGNSKKGEKGQTP
jgi:hypothetical protein